MEETSSVRSTGQKASSKADPRPLSGLQRLLPILICGLCAAYVLPTLDEGWVPHDEGTIGQSAERVFRGEVPHRDFDAPYTGGLAALNAAAFRVLGVNLLTPRIVLFAFFLAWLPVFFYVASRWVPPWTAGLATFLAVTWSVPNYTAAMPSWYNLFFAVFGLAALFRYLETEGRRWLFLAGLAGGTSILFKLPGLYFVAAGLLFLVYREQVVSAEEEADPGAGRTPTYSIFVTACVALFAFLVAWLVQWRSGSAGAFHFILPAVGVSGFLIWSEWTGRHGGSSAIRFRRLIEMGCWFLAGVAGPLALLIGSYAVLGGLADLYRGLFVLPAQRLERVVYLPPSLATLWPLIPLAAAMTLETVLPTRWRWLLAGLVLALAAVSVVSSAPGASFRWALWTMMGLTATVVLAGLARLVVLERRRAGSERRQRAFAVVALAAVFTLIQFPTSGPIYLMYVLPLTVLALLIFLDGTPPHRHPIFVAIMVAALVFSVRWINTAEVLQMTVLQRVPRSEKVLLRIERGGIRVNPTDRDLYERLAVFMQSTSNSSYTFATPDVPEAYFLSGLRNPTRTLFDFFDEQDGRVEDILAALDEHDVNVVVLNRNPQFSGAPPVELLAALRERYPRGAFLDGKFLVRWSDDARAPEGGNEELP